ncbi:MAG: 3-hydroxyacyl-ACP dehydratase [Actinobacteria bacterium RBG_19FT_COMBO_54_7]|uniref:3-hydroxyacyl-ACP dehydratase n=1 Tax=Candidatus Solincola sediminis TaxID=1797199 RepID=A0A1F2WMF8_9ACTN|nr:MAG: 3-hydroxyacyl-ACP dehydratase [Candidatus Solincola sediminis]OFW61419.1 MAG: 3-hydroxyacyl-ACP dehydratase [Candidatus Solincola sediminis]OFW70808.1 MAG: 3-hydroxyacyl-ACP dehydratase [Actinobacteria bacterium RBG_19FT_COMBO_54_7]
MELEQGAIRSSEVVETTFDPMAQCQMLLADREFDVLVATGYGRHLAQANFADSVITEIKAFGLGCYHYFPGCRTILDIGGQDTKAISLGTGGKVADFQMNDRCAAGTGKFLEVMAAAMELSLEEMGSLAMQTQSEVKVSSMCTVFAESEVTGLIARGIPRPEIARGLHEAICDRAVALLKRVGVEREVVFAGGVARNPCLRSLLEDRLGLSLLVPENPQIVGALGAALSAL